MKKRIVDTGVYVSVLRDLVEDGRDVSLLISGNSMSPFLVHERDYIYFRKPDRPLKKGDMVFFQRDTGQYVMHRIWKVSKNGMYYIVGDAQTEIEGPVREDQIFARVFRARRKGKNIGPGNFWWEFFARVWIRMIPLRRPAVKLYSILRRNRR